MYYQSFNYTPADDKEYRIRIVTPTAQKNFRLIGVIVEVHDAMNIISVHNEYNETAYIIGAYCNGVYMPNTAQCPAQELELVQPILKSLIDNDFSQEKLSEFSKCHSVSKTIPCEHNANRTLMVTHIHNMALVHTQWGNIIAVVTNDGQVFKFNNPYKMEDEIDTITKPDIINDMTKLKRLGYV